MPHPVAASFTHSSSLPADFDLDTYAKSIIKSRRGRYLRAFKTYLNAARSQENRLLTLIISGILLLSIALPILQVQLDHTSYAIGRGEEGVLLKTDDYMAKKMIFDGREQVYNFNQDYTPRDPAKEIGAGGSLIKAKLYQDPKQGIQITDAINKVDFTMKPLFWVGEGKQQQNRLVFPTFRGNGHLVYTAGALGVKEDITLQRYSGDRLAFSYQLELGDQYEARLTGEGAVGIFGSSLPINGNVSTGNDKDAALLAKARKAAKKDKLLFTLPAPTIKESNHPNSTAKATFSLSGNKLTVTAEHLKQASYPLSIDPTVTAASGYGLFSFDANIETNVYVDPSNNNFERSPLTGGNLLTWTGSSSAAAAHFLGSALVYAGTLYVIGGASTTTTTLLTGSNYVEQAKINSDGTVDTFSGGNATGLPAGGIARFQLLTYNGYIYVVDGITSFTSTAAGGTVSDAVYYTRITSESFSAFTNGAQLKNWSTTTNKPSTAVYDYGATVYNGVMYIAGGYNSAGTVQTAVRNNVISPSGDLAAAWGAPTALSAGRAGFAMQSYNGHLYILGGNTTNVNGTTLVATTLYSSIASDGSIADAAWKSGNSLVSSDGTTTQAIENLGATLAMIYNGYLYVTGGCGTMNSNGSCTNVLNYTQLAQINADGSLGTFFPNDFQNGGTATLARVGTATFGYNGDMYSIGGCSAMLSTNVSCSTTSLTSNYAAVNTTVGDISNNRNPTALPVALYGQSTVVLNGYVYVLGGCLSVSCNGARTANYITYYASIAADGSLGSWSNSTVATNATSLHFDGESTPLFGSANCSTGGTDQCGLAGASAAAYNGYIYVFGGYDGANYVTNVYYMQPNASTGATVTWTTSANGLPTGVTEAGAIAYNNVLYFLGGCNGTTGIGCAGGSSQTAVLKSTIGAAGAPGAFATTSQLQLPTNGLSAFGITMSGNYVYLAGGIDNVNAQNNTILRAKIDSSGNIVTVSSGWATTTGTLSQARRRTVAQVVNGYLYVVGGHNAADPTGPPGGANGTTYGDIQIGKIDMASGGTGDIASFTQSATSTLTARWNPAITFGNGFMYVTGGCTAGPPPAGCTTIGTTDESFVVYNADNIGVNTWNTPSNVFSTNRLGAGTTVYNGYLYLAGGCTTITFATLACSAVTATVAYAAINADGTLGTWSTGGFDLPAARGFGQLVAQNGFLYFIGGQDATGISGAQTTVYKSTIGASGAPGAFSSSGQTALTAARTQSSSAVYAGFIFIAGGYTGSANTNVVYYSTINGSGDITAWTATTSAFTTARRELSLVSAGAYLYVMGGYDGTTYYASVQLATPNTSTGDITAWTTIRELPYKEAGMSAVGANGYIFTFGGRNGVTSTSCSLDTNIAPVNGNGTVGEWQQPANQLASARFGTAAGYSNGYFFVNGGHDCTNIVSTNIVQQSGQLSEAIHATYTRYVDFGTDATFRQLYVLGTNAQISSTDIDKWKIIVKTSTSANNSWGQKYTTTLTGLGTGPNYGTAITFQALNGAGVDQGASQFWDITFDIDQAQSFNFPDSGTPPQITKYDFYFSPGPGKRLRDGKSFINETQSTLDAHP